MHAFYPCISTFADSAINQIPSHPLFFKFFATAKLKAEVSNLQISCSIMNMILCFCELYAQVLWLGIAWIFHIWNMQSTNVLLWFFENWIVGLLNRLFKQLLFYKNLDCKGINDQHKLPKNDLMYHKHWYRFLKDLPD